MSEEIIEQINRLEEERGRGLLSKDWPALAALMDEDLVHVHATGLIENKAAYLESARTKLDQLKFERLSYRVRCFDDVAIATGVLFQSLRIKGAETVVDAKAATTQTWIRRGGRWLQSTFHATRMAD
jgi:hypothetical protein